MKYVFKGKQYKVSSIIILVKLAESYMVLAR